MILDLYKLFETTSAHNESGRLGSSSPQVSSSSSSSLSSSSSSSPLISTYRSLLLSRSWLAHWALLICFLSEYDIDDLAERTVVTTETTKIVKNDRLNNRFLFFNLICLEKYDYYYYF
jgi:hypothetical protein